MPQLENKLNLSTSFVRHLCLTQITGGGGTPRSNTDTLVWHRPLAVVLHHSPTLTHSCVTQITGRGVTPQSNTDTLVCDTDHWPWCYTTVQHWHTRMWHRSLAVVLHHSPTLTHSCVTQITGCGVTPQSNTDALVCDTDHWPWCYTTVQHWHTRMWHRSLAVVLHHSPTLTHSCVTQITGRGVTPQSNTDALVCDTDHWPWCYTTVQHWHTRMWHRSLAMVLHHSPTVTHSCVTQITGRGVTPQSNTDTLVCDTDHWPWCYTTVQHWHTRMWHRSLAVVLHHSPTLTHSYVTQITGRGVTPQSNTDALVCDTDHWLWCYTTVQHWHTRLWHRPLAMVLHHSPTLTHSCVIQTTGHGVTPQSNTDTLLCDTDHWPWCYTTVQHWHTRVWHR